MRIIFCLNLFNGLEWLSNYRVNSTHHSLCQRWILLTTDHCQPCSSVVKNHQHSDGTATPRTAFYVEPGNWREVQRGPMFCCFQGFGRGGFDFSPPFLPFWALPPPPPPPPPPRDVCVTGSVGSAVNGLFPRTASTCICSVLSR